MGLFFLPISGNLGSKSEAELTQNTFTVNLTNIRNGPLNLCIAMHDNSEIKNSLI